MRYDKITGRIKYDTLTGSYKSLYGTISRFLENIPDKNKRNPLKAKAIRYLLKIFRV